MGVESRLRSEAFADVLTAAQAGGGWALQRLYEQYAPSVGAFLRMRGASDPEAVTNDVFLGVFEGIGGFSGDEDNFRSWLFTIAHRRLIDDYRRRSARPRTTEFLPEVHESAGGDAEAEALTAIADGEIAALLAGLTEDQRDVILLRIIGDLTIEETAEALGKRPGAIKQLQRRGLEALRREISTAAVPA